MYLDFYLIIKICLIYEIRNIALLAKLACFNLAAKFSAVNLLNSGEVIYLSWL